MDKRVEIGTYVQIGRRGRERERQECVFERVSEEGLSETGRRD